MAEQSKAVCKECGGDNVQAASVSWCEGCNEHVELVRINSHQALLMKLISEAGVQGKDALACVTIAKDHNIL